MKYYYQGVTKEGSAVVLGSVSEGYLTAEQIKDMEGFGRFIGEYPSQIDTLVFPIDDGTLVVRIKEWAAFSIVKEEE